MRKQINEDRRLKHLDVRFSREIRNYMEIVKKYNRENTNGLLNWKKYIEGLISYISNPVIAWDNMGHYPRFPNGAVFIRDYGYNTAFVIKNNSTTNKDYLYVFKMNLKLEDFGLKTPQISEAKGYTKRHIRLTESQLRNIIYESVFEVIDNTRMIV